MPSEAECKSIQQKHIELEMVVHTEFKNVHNHIRELRTDLSDHILEQSQRHNDFMEASQRNTDAINKLTDSTQGLVEAWTAANGVVKTMSVIGNVIKWLSAVGVAIGLIWAWVTGGLGK